MRIYVASSWRNERQPEIVTLLRNNGHEVYDFRNPEPGDNGFHWSEIDADWKGWSPGQFRDALTNDIAINGFKRDFEAMKWADAFVLVMPCGRSAHLETGWAIGAGKPTAILLSDGEPELMYAMADQLCTNTEELVKWASESECAKCKGTGDIWWPDTFAGRLKQITCNACNGKGRVKHDG